MLYLKYKNLFKTQLVENQKLVYKLRLKIIKVLKMIINKVDCKNIININDKLILK